MSELKRWEDPERRQDGNAPCCQGWGYLNRRPRALPLCVEQLRVKQMPMGLASLSVPLLPFRRRICKHLIVGISRATPQELSSLGGRIFGKQDHSNAHRLPTYKVNLNPPTKRRHIQSAWGTLGDLWNFIMWKAVDMEESRSLTPVVSFWEYG